MLEKGLQLFIVCFLGVVVGRSQLDVRILSEKQGESVYGNSFMAFRRYNKEIISCQFQLDLMTERIKNPPS